jgi:hypothetical protein
MKLDKAIGVNLRRERSGGESDRKGREGASRLVYTTAF